jgi:hypothetical protein
METKDHEMNKAYLNVKKVPCNRPEGPEEGGGRSRSIALLYLDLGTVRVWVISTKPRPI